MSTVQMDTPTTTVEQQNQDDHPVGSVKGIDGYKSLKLVRLDQVISSFVEDAYDSLKGALPDPVDKRKVDGDQIVVQDNANVKKKLLLALHRAKQRLMRLDIICQWSHKAKAAVQCKRALDACRQDSEALVAAADQLAYLHSELLHTKAPLFDVPLAYKILCQGNFEILPRRIWKEILSDKVLSISFSDPYFELNEVDKDRICKDRMLFALKSKLVEDMSNGHIPESCQISIDSERMTGILSSQYSLYKVEIALVPAPPIERIMESWDLNGEASSPERSNGVDYWRWTVFSIEILPDLNNTVESSNWISPGTMSAVKSAVNSMMWLCADFMTVRKLGMERGILEDQRQAFGEAPLLQLDTLLLKISSHILVGVVLVEAARALESGSWKDLMKVTKPIGANGIRIEIWHGIPVMEENLLAENQGSQSQAAIEIILKISGEVKAQIHPDVHGATNDALSYICSNEGSSSMNLNNYLLRTASQLAALQIEGIHNYMQTELSNHTHLKGGSSVLNIASGSGANQSPMIEMIAHNENILSLSINLKTGYPLFILGPSVLDDGFAYEEALGLVESIDRRLKSQIKEIKNALLPKGWTLAMHYCSMVARTSLDLWAEMVTLISLRHLLVRNPFSNLKRCENVPTLVEESGKHTLCFQVTSSASLKAPKTISDVGNRQRYIDHLIGYLAVRTEFGKVGFQYIEFMILQANQSCIITKERALINDIPSWNVILEEVAQQDCLIGNKRSRDDQVKSSTILRFKLSESAMLAMQDLESFLMQKFAHESLLLQCEELELQPLPSTEGLTLTVGLPRDIIELQKKLALQKEQDSLLEVGIKGDLSEFKASVVTDIFREWPRKIFGRELPIMTDSPSKCENQRDKLTITYENLAIEAKWLWDSLLEMFHVFSCQASVQSLLAQNIFDANLECECDGSTMKIFSITKTSIEFHLSFSHGWRKSIECNATLLWEDGSISKHWPDAESSLVCLKTLSLDTKISPKILNTIQQVMANATDEVPDIRSCMLLPIMQLSYLGIFLEESLLGEKVQKEASLLAGSITTKSLTLNRSDDGSYSVYYEVELSQARSMVCSCTIDATGFKDFDCRPLAIPTPSHAWFDQIWDMWRMENGWNLEKRGEGVFVAQGDLQSLHTQCKELLFCTAGQR